MLERILLCSGNSAYPEWDPQRISQRCFASSIFGKVLLSLTFWQISCSLPVRFGFFSRS